MQHSAVAGLSMLSPGGSCRLVLPKTSDEALQSQRTTHHAAAEETQCLNSVVLFILRGNPSPPVAEATPCGLFLPRALRRHRRRSSACQDAFQFERRLQGPVLVVGHPST